MKKTQLISRQFAKVHNWQPPCSCGVELNTALETTANLNKKKAVIVHNWQPPCSCGISLDEVLK